MNSAYKSFLELFAIFIILISCSEAHNEKSVVKIRLDKFPNTINSVTSTSFQAFLVQKIVFNGLLTFDSTGLAIPLLAKKLPRIEKQDSTVHLNYEIREEAKWDDGSPVTSADVEFSLKLYKSIFLPSSRMRLYLEGIENIVKGENPKEFYLVGRGNPFDLTNLSGDFDVLQRNYYDSQNLLAQISISQMSDTINSPKYNIKVKRFIDGFLADNFKFKNNYLIGSGPYKIEHVEQGKFIRLEKKMNWWGDQLASLQGQFVATPTAIEYIHVPEDIVALNEIKNQHIDVLVDISSNQFVSLKESEMGKLHLDFYAPIKHRFTYFSINSRLEKYKNKNVRKAIRHLLNVDAIIQGVEKGYALQTIGPISPNNKYYYNDKISSNRFDPTLAQKLLRQSGYMKKDKKWYKSQLEPLTLNLITRKNPVYEYIAQVFKGEAEKIGITVEIQILDGRTVSKRMRNHQYEIGIGALTGNPVSVNFQPLFSQESAKLGGLNYSGFGNNMSDSLLLLSNSTADSVTKRLALFKLQEILHEEATMLFLYFSQNKIAVNKRFEESSLQISGIKPGYNVSSFKLKEEDPAD